jgi:hypothetical protein
MQIIIAWTEETREIVRVRRSDLGELPITRPALLAHACVWLLEGAASDLKKAHAYALRNGYQVHTFPVGCESALDDAKKRVLASSRLLKR